VITPSEDIFNNAEAYKFGKLNVLDLSGFEDIFLIKNFLSWQSARLFLVESF